MSIRITTGDFLELQAELEILSDPFDYYVQVWIASAGEFQDVHAMDETTIYLEKPTNATIPFAPDIPALIIFHNSVEEFLCEEVNA